jgi:transcriptional antiterminator RfaH
MKHWYVIYTKQGKEGNVKIYLTMKGLEIFNPLMKTFSSGPRSPVELKSLFPNYIFGRFDLYESYPLVRWAHGVRKVLGFGGYPAPVSEEAIEIIKNKVDEKGVARIRRRFEANDSVRIRSGSLKDLIGIFEGYVSDSDRVRILLNLIGYQPAVELHDSMIETVA